MLRPMEELCFAKQSERDPPFRTYELLVTKTEIKREELLETDAGSCSLECSCQSCACEWTDSAEEEMHAFPRSDGMASS